ncbi:MAG: dephospho-CoA kinase [Mariniblastus sp.]|nr:dephospho-CoA kinase [Mariniblastus sp.]
MLVIGVAGGIASGKSSVADCFERLGAAVLSADQIGHQILREPEVKQEIVENWGQDVLKDGQVDRAALAQAVFGPADAERQLARLERITHPIIGQRIVERLAELESVEVPAVVLDAPVMFKSGWDRFCDKIVYVHTDLASRQQRAADRGWSVSELARRESLQVDLETKRLRATDQIDNSLSKENLFLQVETLWRRWRLPMP